MDLLHLVVYALVAGTAITLASNVARRWGIWGGIAASAPVTPTFAVLLMHQAGQAPDLAAGLPSIVATLVVLMVAMVLLGDTRDNPRQDPQKPVGTTWFKRIPFGVLVVLLVPPLAWALTLWVPRGLVVLLLVLTALFAGYRLRSVAYRRIRAKNGVARPSTALRFSLGAASVFLVATALEFLPALALLVAMFPLIFTAGLFVAELDGGKPQAAKLMAGGVPGSMGVATFALLVSLFLHWGSTSVPLLLFVGWLGYLLVSGLWLTATVFLQSTRHGPGGGRDPIRAPAPGLPGPRMGNDDPRSVSSSQG